MKLNWRDDTAQMTKDLNKVARDTNTPERTGVNRLLAVLLQQKLQGSVSGRDASVPNAGAGGNGGRAASDAAMEAPEGNAEGTGSDEYRGGQGSGSYGRAGGGEGKKSMSTMP